jgi:hypothetical protein
MQDDQLWKQMRDVLRPVLPVAFALLGAGFWRTGRRRAAYGAEGRYSTGGVVGDRGSDYSRCPGRVWGLFWAGFGSKPSAGGPSTGPKLLERFVQAIWTRLLVSSPFM